MSTGILVQGSMKPLKECRRWRRKKDAYDFDFGIDSSTAE